MLSSLLYLIDVIVMLLFVTLCLRWAIDRGSFSGRERTVFTFAFVVRVLYAVVDNHFKWLVGNYDFVKFNRELWGIALLFRESGPAGLLRLTEVSGDLYYYVYGLVYAPVYALFGQQPLLVQFVSVLFGVLFVMNIYRITVYLHNETAAFYAAAFTAIFPYWIYLSASLYRDMLIILTLSEVVYLTLRWSEDRRFISRRTAILGFVVFAALVLRIENVVPVGVLLGTAMIFKPYSQRIQTTTRIAAIVSLAVVLYLFSNRFPAYAKIEYIRSQRIFLTRGGGQYLPNVLPSNIFELLAFVPIGSIYFLLVPFPWQVHNIKSLLAASQNVFFWYPVLAVSILGIYLLFESDPDKTVILLSYTLAGIVGYGLVEGNTGPVVRHRSQFQFCFVVFAVIATDKLLTPIKNTVGTRLWDRLAVPAVRPADGES